MENVNLKEEYDKELYYIQFYNHFNVWVDVTLFEPHTSKDSAIETCKRWEKLNPDGQYRVLNKKIDERSLVVYKK